MKSILYRHRLHADRGDAAVSGADAGGAGDDESGQDEECGEGCGGRADQK